MKLFRKKKSISTQLDEMLEQTPMPENPPVIERRIISSMTLINNRTSERFEYYNKEGNVFGLDWKNLDSGFMIIQRTHNNINKYEAISRFSDHSVIDIQWETIIVDN